MKFTEGQRWMSQTEPELGLGLISAQESKTVEVYFPESRAIRTYGKAQAPLKRVCFEAGEQILTQDDQRLEVTSVSLSDGLLTYSCGELSVPESDLSAKLQFSRPQERFLNGFIDSLELYQLRRETLKLRQEILSHPFRGLLGAKISLIPHQLYIAHRASQMHRVRVLLADQVGLGKTIEACLILNRLLMTSRDSRVLIIVPDSLVHQWFFELYRRFSLSFALLNQETPLEKGENPFVDNENVIISMGLLKGSTLAQELMEQAQFDLLVVDEAHGLKINEHEKSFEFSLVEKWAQKVSHLILLSATPEQFGERAHFERLRLIDPEKFHSFESYQESKKEYQKWASLLTQAREYSDKRFGDWPETLKTSFIDIMGESASDRTSYTEVAKGVVDLYGPGRIYYRNIRKTMEKDFLFFPKRKLHPHALELSKKQLPQWSEGAEENEAVFKVKFEWLKDLLTYELKNQKVLLISRSKKKILELEKKLKTALSDLKMGSFHSDLSLTARDRQAAYFADPQGAQLLLCTEVGSEGRNFEFCQNLILFELPLHPLSLEQRIGRLDRIGQKRDIEIHVPYIQQSWEEILFQWYHSGLNAFEDSSEAADKVFDSYKNELRGLLQNPEFERLKQWNEEVQKTKKKFEVELESGRDILVELNSFDPYEAKNILRNIERSDADQRLSDYMERTFEALGVEHEELTGNISYIRPGDNMFVPVFPNLDTNGLSLTFSRSQALQREEIEFLSWDHPMPLGCMELILAQNFGSTCFVQRKQTKATGQLYLEALYVFECPAPQELELEKFGIGEVVRVLIDDKGQDLSTKWTQEIVDSKVVSADAQSLEKIKQFPRKLMDQLVSMNEKKAIHYFDELKEQTCNDIQAFYSNERQRLQNLEKNGAALCATQLEHIETLELESLKALSSCGLRLDSVRIIG